MNFFSNSTALPAQTSIEPDPHISDEIAAMIAATPTSFESDSAEVAFEPPRLPGDGKPTRDLASGLVRALENVQQLVDRQQTHGTGA